MNIPTAEIIANNIDDNYFKVNGYYLSTTMPIEFAKRTAIEFTKLHCVEQAKVISEKATTKEVVWGLGVDNIIDKDSIINAYDLANIK